MTRLIETPDALVSSDPLNFTIPSLGVLCTDHIVACFTPSRLYRHMRASPPGLPNMHYYPSLPPLS